jgi:hypothetical protein
MRRSIRSSSHCFPPAVGVFQADIFSDVVSFIGIGLDTLPGPMLRLDYDRGELDAAEERRKASPMERRRGIDRC